jgi:hypothetical protein
MEMDDTCFLFGRSCSNRNRTAFYYYYSAVSLLHFLGLHTNLWAFVLRYKFVAETRVDVDSQLTGGCRQVSSLSIM